MAGFFILKLLKRNIVYDIIRARKDVTHIPKIELYATEDGREVVADFLDSLPPKHHAKAIREIEVLEQFGNTLKEPYVKHIEGEIWELRIKFASDISRIFYFTWRVERMVLLHGYIKKTQKTPRAEIETAKKRLADYKRRYGESLLKGVREHGFSGIQE